MARLKQPPPTNRRFGKAPAASSFGLARPYTAGMVQLCGCYHDIASGADISTEPLPRVDVKAHATIFSTATKTELTQTFVNSSKTQDISECRYVFPLFDGVSVVAFTCQVGPRTINGVVKEKTEAKKVFHNAVSQGETAGLLEQGPSTDVFVTSLGNIPAGKEFLVKITFVGELKHDLALQGIRFTLPTIISPRYGSGGPQGDIDSSEAKGISITVDINMPTECPIEEVRSPSHPIALSLGRTSVQSDTSPNLSKAFATLSLGEAVLDKDFVLEVRHKDSGKSRAILETHPIFTGQRALMMTLVPQMGPLQGENPEVIIVADQSGSMQGGRTATLVTALRVLLKSLPVGLKFNICAFGSTYSFLWKRSHKYDEKSLSEALKFVESFNGHLGGTETMSAVQASIESRDPTENLSLILATDGDIWRQEALFSYLDDQVANSESLIRVFPLGIGNSVSSGLIEGVARAGHGFASSVGEGEKLDTKVIRMLKGAMTPDSGAYTMEIQYHNDRDEEEYNIVERVTDSLRIMMVDDSESSGGLGASAMVMNDDENSPKNKSNAAGVVTPKLLQAPQILPPLYPLSRTTVYVLLSPNATHATPKTVILRNNAPENAFEISIPVEVSLEPATTIHSLAAKRAILELEEGRGWLSHAEDGQGLLIKDVYTKAKYDEIVKAEAVRLGVQYQVTGKYTSSVAVESNISLDDGRKTAERDITIAPRPVSPVQELGRVDVAQFQSLGRAIAPNPAFPTHRLGSHGGAQFHSFGRESAPPPPPSAAAYGAMSRTSMRKRKAAPEYSVRGASPLLGTRGGTATFGASRVGSASFSSTRYGSSAHEPSAKSEEVIDYSDEDMGFGAFDDVEAEVKQENFEGEGSAKVVSDKVQKLIALQSFAGFWKYEKNLLEICSISGFPKQPKKTESKVWGTIIALEYLESKLYGEKETWEMVAQKAWAWLKTQGFEQNGKEVNQMVQDAKKLIQGA